ncbi:MAG TPA: VWA domain-containing protein [Candidatus Aquilonibacter sp.]|jgi:VWFA-related protein|nr:VWA domain-containing protein [Candidatus Aquilonibacter sp.]
MQKFATLALSLSLFFSAISLSAQDQSSQPTQNPPSSNEGKPKQEAPPDAGGPGGDIGPYAIPRKNPDEAPPPPPPPPLKKDESLPDYSIRVNAPLVNVDVLVTTKSGQFIPGLKKENFRLFEDGAAQNISSFTVSKAPITAVLLVEFASTTYSFIIDALEASYAFANTLQKDDWVAVSYYDMQPHILVDFTQDKKAVYGALNQMRIPGFAETNLFDALYDTLDRLDRVEGKKYIILVTTGYDSFSKLTLDKITKKVKDTKDVTIFPISVGQIARIMGRAGNRSMGIHASEMDYLQADNEMRTFAAITGGRAYFPRFQGEYGEDFLEIGNDIRHQYSITYRPTNDKLDGTYRKLKVEVVAPDGGPLKVKDQKGKDQKVDVVARDGYTARHSVD